MNALLPATLIIEALVTLLVIPAVAHGHSHVALNIALAAVLASCLILVATRTRHRGGRVVGTFLQLALIASGLLAWPMWILGVLLTAVWIAALRTVHQLSPR